MVVVVSKGEGWKKDGSSDVLKPPIAISNRFGWHVTQAPIRELVMYINRVTTLMRE